MPGVAVVTDSTSSLAPAVAEQAGVVVVPLQVIVDGTSRPESFRPGLGTMTPGAVAAALREGRTVSTSRPAPEAFSSAYAAAAERGASAIVSVHLSGAISSTRDAAELAAPDGSGPGDGRGQPHRGLRLRFRRLGGRRRGGRGRLGRGGGGDRPTSSRGVGDLLLRGEPGVPPARWADRRRAGSAGIGPRGQAAAERGGRSDHLRTNGSGRCRGPSGQAGGARDRGAGFGRFSVWRPTSRCCTWTTARPPTGLARSLKGRGPRVGSVRVSEVSAVLGVHCGPGTVGVVVVTARRLTAGLSTARFVAVERRPQVRGEAVRRRPGRP